MWKSTGPIKVRTYGSWLGYLIVGLYFGWLILSMTPFSDAITGPLSRIVPGWVAMLNWGLSLVLAAVCLGPLAVPTYLRIPLFAFFLVSCVFLPVSFRSHPASAISILALLYVEAFWFIPRWQAKSRREPNER